LFLAACGLEAGDPFVRCNELRSLDVAKSEQDALAAKLRGDVRLLMIGGLVGEVPGADERNWAVRMIEGTTDRETTECRRLRHKAESYARRYNQRMTQLVSP
jgi:hypothetical protein